MEVDEISKHEIPWIVWVPVPIALNKSLMQRVKIRCSFLFDLCLLCFLSFCTGLYAKAEEAVAHLVNHTARYRNEPHI